MAMSCPDRFRTTAALVVLVALPAAVMLADEKPKDGAAPAGKPATAAPAAAPANTTPTAVPTPPAPRDLTVEERGGGRGGLTEDQSATVLELIRAQRPALAARIEVLNPTERREAINRAAPKLRNMIEMKRNDPQGYELYKQQWILENQAGDLARRLKSVKGDEAAKLHAELRAVSEQQFDIRSKLQDRDVSKLETRVAQLRADIQKQQNNRDQLIENQMKRLLASPPAEEVLPGKKPDKAEKPAKPVDGK